MISVIVPIKNDSAEVASLLARFATAAESELIVADGTEGARGSCLARAATQARGEIFFFLHADSSPPKNALALIRETLARGASAGAFSLAYEPADPTLRWIAWWANLRSRWLRLPYGDQGIFCRRDAYEAAGGFRDLPVCDDVDLVRRLRRVGPFVIRRETTTTSPRRYRERGAWRQVLLVWKVVGGYFLGVSPETLGRWYFGSESPTSRRPPE